LHGKNERTLNQAKTSCSNNTKNNSTVPSLRYIYTTFKITSEFNNVSVTVGVVDGPALHGKQT